MSSFDSEQRCNCVNFEFNSESCVEKGCVNTSSRIARRIVDGSLRTAGKRCAHGVKGKGICLVERYCIPVARTGIHLESQVQCC